MTHWAKFDEALADLTVQRDRFGPAFFEIFDRCTYALRSGQRFYVPDAATVLIEGRAYDDFKDLLKLPFNTIALLSETRQRDTGREGMKITIALDVESEDDSQRWMIFSANNIPAERNDLRWLLGPPVPMHMIIPREPGGLKYFLAEDQSTAAWIQIAPHTPDEMLAEFRDDLAAITTLCLMLNTVNVRTVNVAPSAKLNLKRERSGKAPLYSYHVLDVDGEVWDRPERTAPAEPGAGVRSHLRRGHIRRLPKGPTWVRAAYVHGSRDGFLDKDYNVKGPT